MVRDAQLLLRLDWRLDRRQSHDLSLVVRLVGLILALILIGFSSLIGYGAGRLASTDNGLFVLAAGTVPGLLLTLLLFSLLFSGFNQALRALFLTGDMERLIVAPVRTPAVMTAKLLSRMPTMIKLTMMAVTPALIAYGVGINAGPLYYASGLLLVLGAPLFGLAVGAFLAMMLVRILPLRRLNEYVSAAYIILGMAVALGIQLPMILYGRNQVHVDTQSVQAVEFAIEKLGQVPLPSMWAGRGMVALGQGQLSHVGDLLVYLLLTFGLFAATIPVASRLYLSGWLRMQGASVKSKGTITEPGLLSRRSLESTLALKDWLQRMRDSRQVATLFSQAAGAAIVIIFLLRPRSDGGLLTITRGFGAGTEFWWILALASPGVILSGATLFAGWLLFANTARSSLALEQKSFYILKAAPISPLQVWRGKTLGVLVPYTLLVTALLIGFWYMRPFSMVWLPYAWLCLLIIGGGMLAFMTAMGFPWVNLNWEDPRRMGTRQRQSLQHSWSTLLCADRLPAGNAALRSLLALAGWHTCLCGAGAGHASGHHCAGGWLGGAARAQQAWTDLGETTAPVPSRNGFRRRWIPFAKKR